MVNQIGGALDIQLPDGARIWCPPRAVQILKYKSIGGSIPAEIYGYVVTRPYWTKGPKCKPQQAGPELNDDEIKEYVLPYI